MFGMISNFRNLYVADYFSNNELAIKIVFSNSTNFVIDRKVFHPFATDLKTGTSVLVTNSNHVKKLNYYVNCFGFPRNNIRDKEKQKLVMSEVKHLKKLRKI